MDRKSVLLIFFFLCLLSLFLSAVSAISAVPFLITWQSSCGYEPKDRHPGRIGEGRNAP